MSTDGKIQNRPAVTTLDNDSRLLVDYTAYRGTTNNPAAITKADFKKTIGFTNITVNTTLTVGVSGDYASITDCLEDISTWVIAEDVILTIQLEEGIFQENVILDHPYGSRIMLQGAATQAYTFVSLVGITSNGASDHDVEIEFTSVDNISINDYFTIRGTTGTGEYKTLEGCWKVTAVDTIAKTVTFKNTDKRTTIGSCTLATGAFRRLKTIIAPTSGIAILVRNLWGSGSGNATGIKNLGLVGNGTASNGIFLEYGATLASAVAEIGINGFTSRGIYGIYAGTINAQFVCVSNCSSNGVYALNGSVFQIVTCAVTGNRGSGLVASSGSTVACTGGNFSGNDANMQAGAGSNIVCNNAWLVGGASSYSILSDAGSSIDALGSTCVVDSNLAYSLRARNNSFIDFNSGTITGSPTTTQIFAEKGGTIYVNGATYSTSVPSLNYVGAQWGLVTDTLLASSATAQAITNLTIGSNGANIKGVISGTFVHNFGSISANTQLTQTFTLSGVSLNANNVVSIGHNGATVNGLVLTARVSGTDEITISAANITTGSISVSNRTYRVAVTLF